MPSHVIVQEKKQDFIVLIIDKHNLFAENIAEKLDSGIVPVIISESVKKITGKSILLSPNRAYAQMPQGIYSHIFYVWEEEKENIALAKKFFEKVGSPETKILCIVPYGVPSHKIKSQLKQFSSDSYIVLYAELFGGGKSMLDNLILDAIEKNRVVLPYPQEKELVIFSYDDTIEGILNIAFAQHNIGKIFFAFSDQKYTMLGLFHALQQKDPLLKIDFSESKKKLIEKDLTILHQNATEKGKFQEEVIYLFPSTYPVLPEFVKSYEKKLEKKQYPKEKLLIKDNSEKKSNKSFLITPLSKVLYGFYILITLIIFPFLATFILSASGFLFLYITKYELSLKNTTLTQMSANAADRMFEISLLGMPIAIQEARLFNVQSIFHPFVEIIQQGNDVAKIVSNAKIFVELVNASQNNKNISSDIFSQIPLSLSQGMIYVEDAISRKNSLIKTPAELALKEFQKNGNIINLLEVFPIFWNTKGKQTFIIFFQNNMELRPGGGFIGSYGLLTLENGKVEDFHIEDVYDADGQLKGHVEPPFFIRRYLPIPHLYLRDSNYSADFLSNAVTEANLFQEERRIKINGVLAVDLSFFKKLLEKIGPVYVPGYKETVDKDNFFLVTEKHVESNFFPGSSQKSDFLHALFLAVEDKLHQSPPSILNIFSLFNESILEKHLLISSIDPKIQSELLVNGMSSSLWDKRTDGSASSPQVAVNDFLGLSEANLGANKVNYFVTRNLSQAISIHDGSMSEKVTIEYENNSDGTWPGGGYKNYLRIIVPKRAMLDSISIDNKSQQIIPAITDFHIYEAKGFIPPVGLEVNQSIENGKALFGFLINVLPRGKRKIEISYHFPISTSRNDTTYNLRLFKQPGIDVYPYSFRIDSGVYKITKSSEKLTQKGSYNKFSKEIKEDEDIVINLKK